MAFIGKLRDFFVNSPYNIPRIPSQQAEPYSSTAKIIPPVSIPKNMLSSSLNLMFDDFNIPFPNHKIPISVFSHLMVSLRKFLST